MKKVILALFAVFTTGVISAQSYPKQPDKTIVNYTSDYKGVTVKKHEVKSQTYEAAVQEILQTTKNEKAASEGNKKSINTSASTNNRNKVASTINKKLK